MLEHIRKSATLAFHQWRGFLRSKTFRIGGVGVPLVIASLSWFIILYLPSTTADSTNRWNYFQSELKRYTDDVKGEYAFEQSDNRFVYYVIDGSGLNLAEAIRHEILKRDIANLITFIDEKPRTVWKSWFSGTQSDSTHQYLLMEDASRFSTTEFIERYSIEHYAHRSYLLKSNEKAYSWFVDGWNQHHKKIARQIPEMSFAKYVEIFEPNEEWHESGVFKGYLRMHEMSVDHFGQVALYINDPAFYSVSTEMRDWYQSLAHDVVREQFQNSSLSENVAELPKPDLSFVIGVTPHSTKTLRTSKTQELVRRVYGYIFLLAVGGGLCLLYFDRNLMQIEKSNQTYSLSGVDGRVFGMTFKVISFVAVWFVLLISPGIGLVGSHPDLGEGALGLFFHPLFILHWWAFLVVGLIGFGYVFHVLSVTRGLATTFVLFVVFFIMAIEPILFSSLENNVGICFLPILGPSVAVGLTHGLIGSPMYLSILMVSLVNLFLIRQFCVFAEKRARKLGNVKFDYACPT